MCSDYYFVSNAECIFCVLLLEGLGKGGRFPAPTRERHKLTSKFNNTGMCARLIIHPSSAGEVRTRTGLCAVALNADPLRHTGWHFCQPAYKMAEGEGKLFFLKNGNPLRHFPCNVRLSWLPTGSIRGSAHSRSFAATTERGINAVCVSTAAARQRTKHYARFSIRTVQRTPLNTSFPDLCRCDTLFSIMR